MPPSMCTPRTRSDSQQLTRPRRLARDAGSFRNGRTAQASPTFRTRAGGRRPLDGHRQLVAEHTRIAEKRLAPGERVQIGAADAHPPHAHQRFVVCRDRCGDLAPHEAARFLEHDLSHLTSPSQSVDARGVLAHDGALFGSRRAER